MGNSQQKDKTLIYHYLHNSILLQELLSQVYTMPKIF